MESDSPSFDLPRKTDGADGTDGRSPGAAQKGQPSQADLLTQLAQAVTVFHTSDGGAYATIPVNGHFETHALKKGFKAWLKRAFYQKYKKAPNREALEAALGVIEGKALYDGPEIQVYIRVAPYDGGICIDLGNDNWEVVYITAEGWKVLPKSPVKFRRPSGMLPLPTPVEGGTLDELFPFLNVPDETAKKLIAGFLIQAGQPEGPYPVLEVSGEQGSAKSTLCEFLKLLIDPHKAMRKSPPKDERDLAIAAHNSWMTLFDNLSRLTPGMSDALCRLSTGGAFSSRKLYEDDEEVTFNSKRPVVLNGIEDVVSHADLLERSICITLQPIPPGERRDEKQLKADFEAAAPRILGALYTAIAASIKNLPTVQGKEWPRLADFCKRVTAAEAALGWNKGDFLKAFRDNEESAMHRALEHEEAVLQALRDVLGSGKEWRGTATALLSALTYNHEYTLLPRTANALSAKLKRLLKPLRSIGIDVTWDRQGAPGTRIITVRRVG